MMLSVKDVARRLGVSKSTAYSLVGTEIAFYPIRGKKMVSEADLEAYLARIRIEPRMRTVVPHPTAPNLKHIKL